MRKVIFILAVVLLCGMTACKCSKSSVKEGVTEEVIKSSSPDLADTSWKLVELFSEQVNTEASIAFKADGSVSGNLGCNTFSGAYSLPNETRIKFSNLVNTQKMCLDMTAETKLSQVLNTADSYTISDNRLILNRARMAPLAIFERRL